MEEFIFSVPAPMLMGVASLISGIVAVALFVLGAWIAGVALLALCGGFGYMVHYTRRFDQSQRGGDAE